MRRVLRQILVSLGYFFLVATSALAEPVAEFRLNSVDEIYSEQALPLACLLSTEKPYEVNVPQADGSVERVERTASVFVRLPEPERSKPKHHYRLDDEIAVVGRFPEKILLEGLEQLGGLYTRTAQEFARVEGEKGLYRAEKPATRTELVKESKFLEQLNQFRQDNGLQPLALSLPRLTPFSRSFLRSIDRKSPRIPKVGKLKYFSAQAIYPPSEEMRFFRGDEQISYFEAHRLDFLNPNATEIDLTIQVPEVEKGLFGEANPHETLFLFFYTPH